jgi:hypothetical protein
VVGDGVRKLGRHRTDLAADAAEVVQQLRPLLGQLGEELGELEDVYGSMIVTSGLFAGVLACRGAETTPRPREVSFCGFLAETELTLW